MQINKTLENKDNAKKLLLTKILHKIALKFG